MNLLWHIISDFSENYKNQIRGKYDGKKRININQEISGTFTNTRRGRYKTNVQRSLSGVHLEQL